MGVGDFRTYFFRVLTGETPFPGVQNSAVGYHVLRGKRPDKPENASTIGFSDLLWGFTQRCWDGGMELRPKVGEVVTRLRDAATKWDGLMPPCPQVENVASGSEKVSDSEEYSDIQLVLR